MSIYRFVLKAYPSSTHKDYHPWQRGTLVIFVASDSGIVAEQRMLEELDLRSWTIESFELKDRLIESRVLKTGGEFYEAYLQAEREGFFWLEELDSLPMTQKETDVWGTGVRLNEEFIDDLILLAEGHRVTPEEANEFKEKNADYILENYVLELKQFENEGLEVSTRQAKIAKLFEAYQTNKYVQVIDPYLLNEIDSLKYWDIVGVPVQKRVKSAAKQVKSTLSKLANDNLSGGVILLNTGYLSVPHDHLVEMAERYAAKDTSSIKTVIIMSSWSITNGFDTVVNYAFHPNNSSCPTIQKLRDVFWESVEELMTQMMRGQIDITDGFQEPMSPISFLHNGTRYVYTAPQLKSTLKK